MNASIKNTVAVVAGLIIGSIVNMGIVVISGSIIPPPEGADLTTMDGLGTSMHLFQPKHFLMPFLAHALGAFVGAGVTAFVAASFKLEFALSIGLLFLVGGIVNVFMLPSPLWFTVVDLVLAYIPTSYLAGVLIVGDEEEVNEG
jgi:hypothetical protein